MMSHHYQTAVVRLQPRGEGNRFGSALGSGEGILSSELFKNRGCTSAIVHIESEKINSQSHSSKKEAASTSSFNGLKKDTLKKTVDSSIFLKENDYKSNELANLIDNFNDINSLSINRVNFA